MLLILFEWSNKALRGMLREAHVGHVVYASCASHGLNLGTRAWAAWEEVKGGRLARSVSSTIRLLHGLWFPIFYLF